jgi:hypothetical protein
MCLWGMAGGFFGGLIALVLVYLAVALLAGT